MTDPTDVYSHLSQSAKAARRSFIALLLNIQTAECTSEAPSQLINQLSSVEDALGSFASVFGQAASFKLGFQVQKSLQMVIWNSLNACEIYDIALGEQNRPLQSDFKWNLSNALQDIESHILNERLQLLRIVIDTAIETSALLSSLDARTINDKNWNSILAKENAVLSAVIAANENQRAHQLIEGAAERITCEIRRYGMAMRHHRRLFGGVLSEFHHLRWGQCNDFGNDDQPTSICPQEAPDEIQIGLNDIVIYRNGTPIPRDSGVCGGVSPKFTSVNPSDNSFRSG